uniref:Putative LRR receptor-like protein kinase n=1 Tax=Tanacetum cinerariifolium TaxID=118510 RepID=A0A6L2N6F4_TANCI|nr:putative LRR receptor-like protein kinase [Tanacetum cinerariifolium]
MIIKQDSKIVKAKGERISLALKTKNESSDEEYSTSRSKNEEYAMAVRDFKRRGMFVRQPGNDKKTFQRNQDDKNDKSKRNCFRCGHPNHLTEECPKPPKEKNQRAFVGGSWSDSGEEDDEKAKDEACLMAQASNKVCSESSYFSNENSSIDDFTLDNEYDKLCKMSLKIINKNKQLKVVRNSFESEISKLKEKLSTLEKNKGIDLECINCQLLKIDNEKLKEEALKLTQFEKSTHSLNEMLSNQKPYRDKLGLGFNSFEASTSRSKEIKIVKSHNETPSSGGPQILRASPIEHRRPPKQLRDRLKITKDDKVIGRGIRKKGLHVMKLRNKPKGKICLATIDENSTLWHKRLGHANMRLIQSLASKELARNLPKLKFNQHFCDACKIGKQAHASHKAMNIVSTTRCLGLPHMDLFGPSAVRSYGGNLDTLVIVDDYSRKLTLDYFRVFESKCFILNTKDYLTKFDPKSYKGVFLGYSQKSKAYIILNKHTKKIEESLNVIFNETPPPSKTSPLMDDDLDKKDAIKVIEKKNLENDIEDETLEIDDVVNIKESRNHPLENVIGNLNQRTLRSQTQNQIARLESIRILLAYACALDFKLFQMDVKSAFLNGFINEEVYVAQPPGFIDFKKPDHVYKLKKALYGLKQAPKALEFDTKQARLILPYGMLLTRMFDHVMFKNPELSNHLYVLYDRVMYPLFAQQKRKTRKDYGTRRGRSSTSSSFAFGQPSSSHPNDDDNDGNDERTSSASTPFPTRFVNSLTNECNLHSSGFSFLLAVATFFTGSGNFFCQWKLYNWQWE